MKSYSDNKVLQALAAVGDLMALNLMWTFFYFRLGMYLVAALVLIALIFAVVFTIIRFSQCCVTAGRLMLPYLIWCLFALYLNIAIVVIN